MNKVIKLSAIIILLVVLLASGCRSFTPSTEPAPAPSAPAVSQSEPTTTTPTTQPAPAPPAAPPTQPTPAPTIPEGIYIGNRAPDFQLQTLTGQTVSLSGLRGKPVLINFWATWCPPCKYEMPFLQQVHDSWSDKGLVLLAIDIGESSTTVE
ncbi:MAG: TlpA family protein disulfide reductase, partial [Chloroflexi bacterium]|nr:TlpA family protein disulfide reductase [Chloroflexota bacterium]